MTGQGNTVHIDLEGAGARSLVRWECRCRVPPVLLATYDNRGRIHIKVRDRYWHVAGVVQTICPRCGSEHTLEIEGEKGGPLRSGGEGVLRVTGDR